jgi:hypothetical protein
MDPNIQLVIAILGAAALILITLARTVNGAADMANALGNLCSAVARLVIRFRRLMRVIGRRVRQR